VALSLGVKWQGSEADHSPPSNAEVKNCGTIPPLWDVYLIKERDNFTFNFYSFN
jgi:hypothetical protein